MIRRFASTFSSGQLAPLPARRVTTKTRVESTYSPPLTKPLDTRAAPTKSRRRLAHQGASTGDSRLMERGVVPAGGACNPAPGRSGYRPPSTLRSGCQVLGLGADDGRVTPAPLVRVTRGLDRIACSLKAARGKPRRSAERRARPKRAVRVTGSIRGARRARSVFRR
jgi:hypothetical protein